MIAILLGMLLMVGWVRWRYGRFDGTGIVPGATVRSGAHVAEPEIAKVVRLNVTT